MTKNDDLDEWNKALRQGQDLLDAMRARAIRRKDGWYRRRLMWCIRFMERWMARGRRWRDDDIFGD